MQPVLRVLYSSGFSWKTH